MAVQDQVFKELIQKKIVKAQEDLDLIDWKGVKDILTNYLNSLA